MRFELFVRGKRIAALETEIGKLQAHIDGLYEVMRLATEYAGIRIHDEIDRISQENREEPERHLRAVR